MPDTLYPTPYTSRLTPYALRLMLYALCFLPCAPLKAQFYTESGTPLYLKDGITVTVKDMGITINNDITGSSEGKIYSTGTSSQSINGNGYSIYNLSVSNSSGISLAGNLSVSNTLNIANNTDYLSIGSNTLTLAGTITGNGYLSGTSSSNISISGTGQAGTLRFKSGGQTLNTLSLNRTGISSSYAVLLGSALTVNALTLTNGIIATGDNLLTWTKTGSLLPSSQTSYTSNFTSYKNSYICICDGSGSALSFTEPFDGSKGLRINNVGTDTWFPVGVDFSSPNRIWINNTGTSDNLTVVMKKGDIDNTGSPVVQRIWYINEATTGGTTADMRLYFTKQNNTTFGSGQDEVESGFDYTATKMAQRNYDDDNYLDISQNADIQNISSASNSTEVYAKYSIGISPDVSNSTDGINYFSRFMVLNADAFILPVSVINFRAVQKEDKVLLSWTGSNETNMDKYVIERSPDNHSYSVTGSIQAANAGAVSRAYTFTDIAPLAGRNYYRIKVTENDGKSFYTQVQTLDFVSSAFVKIYPNPVYNRRLTIRINSDKAGRYAVHMYGADGKMVFRDYIDHTGAAVPHYINLPATVVTGLYKLQITNPDNKAVCTENILVE